MIHQSLSPHGVHPQISSSLRLLDLCLVRSDLFVIYYCLFILLRTHSFIDPLDKCHTSVFNALIFCFCLGRLRPLTCRKLANSIAKRIDSCQPAQSAQADTSRSFLQMYETPLS